MSKRNIIVIGASAGGFEACQQLIAVLPSFIDASIFIVWHMSPDIEGVLPQVLNRVNTIPASNARDGEEIKTNRIYVAPPDHHLIIEKDYLRVTRGPKENRFRPAVDPLFRSAAYTYGNRVIGIILSGALDDGTSGLWMIKHLGGVAMVQSPEEALVSSMPENAIREVVVDYVASVAEIAKRLANLSAEEVEQKQTEMKEDERTHLEINIAANSAAFESGIMKLGTPTRYTCPECHGALSAFTEGNRVRYRCHTGHAFSMDALLATVTEKVETSLYNALRTVEESIMLLNNTGDYFAAANYPKYAALYFTKAKEAEERAVWVRQAIASNQVVSIDSYLHTAEEKLINQQNSKPAIKVKVGLHQNGIN